MSVPTTKRQLEYLARMNVIYHEARERLFLRLVRWTAFVTVLLSSAVVASLSDKVLPTRLQGATGPAALVLGVIVAALSGAALAFDWYGQLGVHSKFKAKWTSLAIEAALLSEGDKPAFDALIRELAILNADEPPPSPGVLRKAEKLADAAFGAASKGSTGGRADASS
jgi:hypothetical protein